MKIRCDRNELFERLQSVAGIVSTAPTTRPILQHCLLEAGRGDDGADTLTLSVTDLDISSRLVIERVEVEEPGILALPANRLASLVREVPGSSVHLDATEKQETSESPGGAMLRAGTYEFRLLGEDAAQFPEVKEFASDSALTLPRETFYEMLRRVAVGACRDSSRYQLAGVFVEIEGSSLTMTATDGKRLTHDSMRIDNPKGVAVSSILPNRAVDVMIRVLARGEQTFQFSLEETEVQIALEHGQVMAKLVEGSYPDYSTAIPRAVTTKVRGNKADLLAAAKSASLVTDKETATIQFCFEDDHVRLESKASDIGESRIEVPVAIEGENLSIRFNPVYFIDALRTLGEEEIAMEFDGTDKPGTIRGVENYRHYLMPLVVG